MWVKEILEQAIPAVSPQGKRRPWRPLLLVQTISTPSKMRRRNTLEERRSVYSPTLQPALTERAKIEQAVWVRLEPGPRRPNQIENTS